MTSQSSQPPAWYTKHCQNNLKYGPLPSGIDVTDNGDLPKYNVTIGREPKTFSHHPLSPDGRKEWSSLLPRALEEKGRKADCLGVTHPSFVYKPAEWLWETYDIDPEVLIRALELSGVNATVQAFKDEKNSKAVQELMNKRKQLYHPRDREDLSSFHKEHWYSCWARFFGRGLYIVGPEISKDGKDWNSFQNVKATKRNAIRARHSTGDQDDARPVILGCLPSSTQATKWFVLVPTEAAMKDFQCSWSRCNWKIEARKFNYSDTEKFIWAIVSLQRSMVLKGIPILRDENLGEAITQYGVYLDDENGHGATAFNLKLPAESSAQRVTFHQITRWILTAEKNSSAKRWAKAWDDATIRMVAYTTSLDMSDWSRFLGAAADLQLKK